MLKRKFMLLPLCLALLAPWSFAAGLLKPFETDSLRSIVEKHKGKPFLLLVWSLDCVYCQASLDNLAQVRHDNKALTVVTVSTDQADDPQAAALMEKRLTGLQMTQDAWAFGNASPDRLKYALDPKWHGEKPRSYWFNAKGERIAYSGVLNAATIEKLYAQVAK